MSKTHKTKPLGVKVCQGLVGYTEKHDHSNGPCDLPKMTPDTTGFNYKTRCTYRADFSNPLSRCGCSTCSDPYGGKVVNKRSRHRANSKARDWKKDPELYDEEVIEDTKELW